MNYALIGCGRIASFHIQSALDNKLSIKALCDIKIEKAKELAARFNLADVQVFASVENMLDTVKELDFVSIATDSGSHHSVTMQAFSHNLNVLCEKPLAMSLDDADEMIAAASNKNLIFGVCQQNRLNNATIMVKRALNAGAFGKISHAAVCVRWSRDKSYYANDDWRGKWATDGGTLMNQCIHGFDLLRYLAGPEVESVYALLANRQHPYIEAEDAGLGVIKFKNGVIATAEGTTNVYNDNLEETLTLIGETGTVKLGGQVAEKIVFWQFKDPEINNWKIDNQSFTSVYGDGHSRVFEDFCNAVKEHREPFVSAKAGRDALETILAFYESFRTKQPVFFPLNHCKTTDMTGIQLI